MTHLHDAHNIKRNDGSFFEYLKKFFVIPKCACGCGHTVALHGRKFAFAEFATDCGGLDRCRNPQLPDYYIYRGYSVDETIDAIRQRASKAGKSANTEQHRSKLSSINGGQDNPSSVASIMARGGVDSKTARETLKRQRSKSRGFTGKTHTAETKARMASMRSKQAKIVTKPELAVWGMLHACGIDFEFQWPIGQFVVDFFVPSAALVIDVFGDYWHGRAMKSRLEARQKEKVDAARARFLRASGFHVCVLWESEVMSEPRVMVERIRALCGLRE